MATGSPYAAAFSAHPVSAHAVGEVIGQVFEAVGPHPDLAVLAMTPGHAGALEDVGRAVRRLLGPSVLIGVAAAGVSCGPVDFPPGPSIVLWAGMVGPVAPLVVGGDAGHSFVPPFHPEAVVLLGDVTSPHPSEWPDLVAPASDSPPREAPSRRPRGGRGPFMVGGITSAAGLLVQDTTRAGVVVGAVLGAGAHPDLVHSEGNRPVGPPFLLSRAERDVVYELGERTAMDALRAVVADSLAAEDVHLVNRGLRLRFGDGRSLGPCVAVRGQDRSNGAIALASPVPAGVSRAQFCVRDPRAAGADLDDALGAAVQGARTADAGLLFRSEQRTSAWFGAIEPDAARVAGALPAAALAGCAMTAMVGAGGPASGEDRDGASLVTLRSGLT